MKIWAYSISDNSVRVYVTALLEYIDLYKSSRGLSSSFPERLNSNLSIAAVCCAIHYYLFILSYLIFCTK